MNKTSDIAQLQRLVIKFRDERDWKQFHNAKDTSMSLVLEATELMEHFQWKNAVEINEHIKKHKKDIGEELADALYWILLMSYDMNIDIKDALEKKLIVVRRKYPIKKAKGKHLKYTDL